LKKKYNDSWKNFKEMLHEYKRRMNKAGVLHEYREHEFFESKSRKQRKAKRDMQKKTLMESLAKRILSGERVLTPAGVVKKVVANLKKDKLDKKKDRDNKKYTEGHYENHDD
jgi:ribosomal protein S21